MAGEWIPVRVDLFECPEVVRILSELCPDSVQDLSKRVQKTSEIVGSLIRMWALFDKFTDDGILLGYNENLLDQVVGVPGFASAVERVGWLMIEEEGIKMPEFSRFLGSSAKSRMKDAERKRAERAASKFCPDSVRKIQDENRTTEEKRIEENINTNTPSNPPRGKKPPRVQFSAESLDLPEAINTEEMRSAWKQWCDYRKEIRKPLTESAAKQTIAALARLTPEVAYASLLRTIAKQWQGFQVCPASELKMFSFAENPENPDYIPF